MTKESVEKLEAIFEELATRCDAEGYTYATGDDLDRWSAMLDLHWLDCLNRVGTELAKRYHQGVVGYAFGDSVANDLWGEMISRHQKIPDGSWPEEFDEVYLAFDAGEFRRKKDGDADPIKLYTDPMIADFVAKLP